MARTGGTLTALAPALAGSAVIGAVALPSPWHVPLLGAAAAGVVLARSRLDASRLLSSPLDLPLLAFLIASAAATIGSTVPLRSVLLGSSLLPAILVYALFRAARPSETAAELLFATLALVSFALSALYLWGAWHHAGARSAIWVRTLPSPLLVTKNDCTLAAIAAPLAVVFARRGKVTAPAAVAIAITTTAAAIYVMQSRGAALTLLVSMATFTFLVRPRLSAPVALAAVVWIPAIDRLSGGELTARFAAVSDPRLSLWRAALEMFRDAPVLGVGPHAFATLRAGYVRDLDLARRLPVDHWDAPWPHDLYLELLAERGLAGFVSFVWLVGTALLLAARIARRGNARRRRLGAAAVSALVGICVSGIFELTLGRLWLVIVLFALIGTIASMSTTLGRKDDGIETNDGCDDVDDRGERLHGGAVAGLA